MVLPSEDVLRHLVRDYARLHAAHGSVEEMAALPSLFVALHEVNPTEARTNLDATQRESFDLACAWVASNPLLVEALRDRPELLTEGMFTIEPVRGAFTRWRANRKRERELRSTAAVKRPALTDEKRRHLEEARALVDEVFPAAKET